MEIIHDIPEENKEEIINNDYMDKNILKECENNEIIGDKTDENEQNNVTENNNGVDIKEGSYKPISKEQIMRENIKYLTDFSIFEFNKCNSEYDVYMWRKQYTPFFSDYVNKELAKADWNNLKNHKEKMEI